MINLNVKDDYGVETSLSVAKAREILLNAVSPVEEWETVPIRSALGRILIHDVIAPFNVPAHDNSAMDGFAVCAADFPENEARFTLVGTAYAGGTFSGVVSTGQAVRIMTGAMLPHGADSIVILEDAQVEGHIASLSKVKHVRRAGEDLSAGKPALLAGKRIGMVEANCFILLDEECGNVAVGDQMNIQPFEGLI